MMSGIKGKNTKPEILVRQALFGSGYRFRLHRKDLPGCPDVVLPGRQVAVFVHGCFWHCHAGCRLAKLPSTRPDFWQAKLHRNRTRDLAAIEDLQELGWRVLVVWECYLRQPTDLLRLGLVMRGWIEGGDVFGELSGSG